MSSPRLPSIMMTDRSQAAYVPVLDRPPVSSLGDILAMCNSSHRILNLKAGGAAPAHRTPLRRAFLTHQYESMMSEYQATLDRHQREVDDPAQREVYDPAQREEVVVDDYSHHHHDSDDYHTVRPLFEHTVQVPFRRLRIEDFVKIPPQHQPGGVTLRDIIKRSFQQTPRPCPRMVRPGEYPVTFDFPSELEPPGQMPRHEIPILRYQSPDDGHVEYFPAGFQPRPTEDSNSPPPLLGSWQPRMPASTGAWFPCLGGCSTLWTTAEQAEIHMVAHHGWNSNPGPLGKQCPHCDIRTFRVDLMYSHVLLIHNRALFEELFLWRYL